MSIERSTAILVDTPRTGAGTAVAANFIKRNINVVVLVHDPLGIPHYVTAAYEGMGAHIIKCDTNSSESVIEACVKISETSGIVAIGSVYEYTTKVAAVVASFFNLAGPNPSAVELCRSKNLMRASLEAHGELNPLSRAVNYVEDAVIAAQKIGYPVVVKPATLTGSAFVRYCDNEADLRHHVALILGLNSYMGRDVGNTVLVEEYLGGCEFSVELFNGSVIGVTRKFLGELPFFVEMGHLFPADISKDEEAAIIRVALDAINIIGLSWGACHVEVKYGNRGPRIIEINPRLAGDRIPELIRLATGLDMIDLCVSALLGEAVTVAAQAKAHASIRFIPTAATGTVFEINGVEEVRKRSGVAEVSLYLSPGMIYESNGSNRDRVGHIISSARSGSESLELANSSANAIDVIWV